MFLQNFQAQVLFGLKDIFVHIPHYDFILQQIRLKLTPHYPSSNIGTDDASSNTRETGSNRTRKRFMTLKKSKANEFLKRGRTCFDS